MATTYVSNAERAHQELEYRKCARSFKYFKNNYCMMWTKEGGDPIRFVEWEFQNDAADKMQHEQKLIFLKARQMGLSWMACAYVVWSVLFKKNFHVYITSIGLKEVQEQMERIRFIWYNLPSWLLGDVVLGGKGCKDNDTIIEFSHGSAIHAIASTKSGGHGAAPGLYILDEFSRKENDIMAWRAIKPSLGKQSQVIIISTSNGLSNLFADLWFSATKGDNGFKPVFYAWREHPEYSDDYVAEQKRDFAGDLQGFLEAFPEKPEDAFLSSSRAVFDSDRIRDWKEYIAEHDIYPDVGYLEYDNGIVKFIEEPTAHFSRWAEPVKGHRYTVGVDIAEGLIKGDWSVAIVVDINTDEVVAMYRAKVEPENYASKVIMLCQYYNNAWCVPESNKGSEIVIGDIKETYPYIYRRPVRNKLTDIPTLVVGFLMTGTSKPKVISNLRRKFSDYEKPLRIYSPIILDEMFIFEDDERHGLGAPKGDGKHDDCVIALALAWEGASTLPYMDDDTDDIFHFGNQPQYSWRSL